MSYSLGQDEGPTIPDYLLEERNKEEAAKTKAVKEAKINMLPWIGIGVLGIWFLTKKK